MKATNLENNNNKKPREQQQPTLKTTTSYPEINNNQTWKTITSNLESESLDPSDKKRLRQGYGNPGIRVVAGDCPILIHHLFNQAIDGQRSRIFV
jgi:hypothetical protein